ncbi:MAG: UrcA family protein [Hyphomonadaceae bacterium]|nr:UrcA family protein [Hyphomonadaceae bacterium]
MSRTITAIACASLLALGAAAPAMAQVESESRVVRFGDLNLKNPHDAGALVNRIESASRQVCDNTGGAQSLAERRHVRPCRTDAEQRAVYDVNHPMVTAEYYGVRPQVVIEGSYDPDPLMK